MNEGSVYDTFAFDAMNGLSLTHDDIRVMLVLDYEFDPSHARRADVLGAEVEGKGYERGGQPLRGRYLRREEGGRSSLHAEDPLWRRSSIRATGAVFYRHQGDPARDELLCYHDFGREVQSDGGPFEVLLDEQGILTLGRG